MDVLECVAADNGVGFPFAKGGGEVLEHPFDPGSSGAGHPLGPRTRIHANGMVDALLQHRRQEVALPAANLEGRLASKLVLLDPPARQLSSEGTKAWRRRLGLLMVPAVVEADCIVGRVGDEGTLRAEREPHLPHGIGRGLGGRAEQLCGVNGHPRPLEKVMEPGRSAGGAEGIIAVKGIHHGVRITISSAHRTSQINQGGSRAHGRNGRPRGTSSAAPTRALWIRDRTSLHAWIRQRGRSATIASGGRA
jgi:hypothetical protein